MVIWIVIRYITIVGTTRRRVSIFTKAIIVIIKIVPWDVVMVNELLLDPFIWLEIVEMQIEFILKLLLLLLFLLLFLLLLLLLLSLA